jgi:REP element-mobilizing transposase RayT
MENHLHLLVSSPNAGKEIGDFKSWTARSIIDYLNERGATAVLRLLNFYKLKHRKDRNYQVWQEGSHPEMIIDDNMLTQKIEYIHSNPVKRRFVEQADHSIGCTPALGILMDYHISWR